MNEQTHERTNKRTNARTHERTNKQTIERTNERTNERTSERTNEQTNERSQRSESNTVTHTHSATPARVRRRPLPPPRRYDVYVYSHLWTHPLCLHWLLLMYPLLGLCGLSRLRKVSSILYGWVVYKVSFVGDITVWLCGRLAVS